MECIGQGCYGKKGKVTMSQIIQRFWHGEINNVETVIEYHIHPGEGIFFPTGVGTYVVDTNDDSAIDACVRAFAKTQIFNRNKE